MPTAYTLHLLDRMVPRQRRSHLSQWQRLRHWCRSSKTRGPDGRLAIEGGDQVAGEEEGVLASEGLMTESRLR